MGERLRWPAAAVLRTAGLMLAIMTLTTVATGWLYWLRAVVAGWPGPGVPDALPLDELPGHASVPLLAYLAAFGAAAVTLGLGARALRLDRLTAGLVLAAGTGMWLIIIDAFCLLVVRQLPAGADLHGAVRLQAVYLAAVLAGVAGALFGRGSHPGATASATLGWLVAGGGLVDLLPALFPHSGHALGAAPEAAPAVVLRTAHVLLVPAGLLLIITSRGLVRRNRPAWRLAVGLLGFSLLLDLLPAPHFAAAALTGLIIMAVIARRDDFRFSGDPAARPSALIRLLAMLAFTFTFGVTAQWAGQTAAGERFRFTLALLDTLRAAGGQVPGNPGVLPAGTGHWLARAVLSLAATGAIWAAAVLIRPWRQRHLPDVLWREQAAGIVRRWGADTLAPFTLRPDKDLFIAGQTLIAYRVIRGIALVSGDPVGSPAEVGRALDRFLAFAQARGWRTAVLGASDRMLGIYTERGLHPLYHGDEAVIEVAGFSLTGRPMRAVRQAVHRLGRRGFSSEILTAGQTSPALRAELTAVEHAWLRGASRKGFTMELGSLFSLGGDDALFVIGRDEHGRVAGFLHLAVCRPSQSLSLSTMPRWRDTANGFTAWLITETVAWAREHGFRYVSLNFSPFAGLLDPSAKLHSRQRLQRDALLRLKGVLSLQLDNLLHFNGQFRPAWRPRYLVVQGWPDLPRVAVAAMAAEGYLPHAGLVRGRDWSVPAPRSRTGLASPAQP